MPAPNLPSGVGAAPLPDIGSLVYNGVTWNCLYTSKMNGVVIQDNAERTTRLTEYTLDVEGKVTLNPGDNTIDNTMTKLRQTLEVHGGQLTYFGKGFGSFIVNVPGGQFRDVKWGPVPRVLYFQPLGGSNSALVKWQCITRVAEVVEPGAEIIQFNYEADVSYDEDCYSTQRLKGTLEIAMTRNTVRDRTIPNCVDKFRDDWLNIEFDLTRFRVTRRNFNFSRDKRTAEWEYIAEELPPMGLPAGATSARGLMSVHKLKSGIVPADTIRWVATLRGTYAIRADQPRRLAAEAFFSLLWFRMQSSANNGGLPIDRGAAGQQGGPAVAVFNATLTSLGPLAGAAVLQTYNSIFSVQPAGNINAQKVLSSILMDFSFDEGLYLDSKTITFSASWMLVCKFVDLLRATGAWRWAEEADSNAWIQSLALPRVPSVLAADHPDNPQGIMGSQSWLANRLDETVELIVDMGGGNSLSGPPFVTQ